MKITVGIPTKNRYESLSHTLLSIAFQTRKPDEVIIVDDSDNPQDIRTVEIYRYIFQLFDEYKIAWKVFYGQKKGQHYSHSFIQQIAEGDWIFRIDDDEVTEPRVLKILEDKISASEYFYGELKPIGAMGPVVLAPDTLNTDYPDLKSAEIKNMHLPNVQWFKHHYPDSIEVEHLHSCFIYKKGVAAYDLSLSPVAHREETIFSHQIFLAGYKLIVAPDAVVYHFRRTDGGIRSYINTQHYEHDEQIFKSYLSLWNVKTNETKWIVLDNGLGDHYAFKHILPELRRTFKDITIAACFPDAFFDDRGHGTTLVSIQDAKNHFGNIDKFNIYGFMQQNNWSDSLVDAFKKMYL